MFRCKTEFDEFGIQQKHYYLTQGDSQYIYVKPQKQGGEVATDDIEICCFRLGKDELNGGRYPCILRRDLEKQEDNFVLHLRSQDTINLRPATYRYQFRFQFDDGSVETLQWYFTITSVIS